jgi:uncharacterized protein YoxC
MSSTVKDIVAGIFMCVIVYLLISNGTKTSQVIDSLAKGAGSMTKTLQGRG